MKIAVFGSAFNPPTLGHKDAIGQCFEQGADCVILIPSYQHAFGKSMGSYEDRLKMTYAFAQDLKKDGLNVVASLNKEGLRDDDSDIDSMIEHRISEDKLKKGLDKTVFSFDLMSYFSDKYKEHEFILAFGVDNIDNLHKFYKGDMLKKNWNIIALEDRKPIRSTLVRNEFKNSGIKSIYQYVTPSVFNEIKNSKQYTNW